MVAGLLIPQRKPELLGHMRPAVGHSWSKALFWKTAV